MIGRYDGLIGKLNWLTGFLTSHAHTLFSEKLDKGLGMYRWSMLDPIVGNAMPSTDEASNIR